MYFMAFFDLDHIEIIHTLTHEAIYVPKQNIGSFIDMLLEVQELQNKETLRRIDIARRASWIKHEGKVFPSTLVGMGAVIPIQKQAGTVGD